MEKNPEFGRMKPEHRHCKNGGLNLSGKIFERDLGAVEAEFVRKD